MLDYIFTRLYRFYNKKEKGGYSIFSSSIFISVLRLLLFYSVVMMLDIFSGGKWSISNVQYNHTGGLWFLFLLSFF